VLACVTKLDIQSIYLGSMVRNWSQEPAVQFFGDQLTPAKIRQTPNCGYTYTIASKPLFPGSNVIDWNSNLPVEVGFNANTKEFSLSKCHTYGVAS